MSILVIADHDNQSIRAATLHTLGAAAKIGGDIAVLVAGSGCGAAAFYAVSGPDFATSRYASDTAALEAICRASGATIVVAPATSRFNRAIPGVTQRLGGRIDTHIGPWDGKECTWQVDRE